MPKQTTEQKVCYLLLDIGAPSQHISLPSEHLRAARAAAKSLGIKIQQLYLHYSGDMPENLDRDKSGLRYIFALPEFKRDDRLASKFAEAIISAVLIVHGPTGNIEPGPKAFNFPKNFIHNKAYLSLDELVKLEESRFPSEAITFYPHGLLGGYASIDDRQMALAWKIVPAIWEPPLSLASNFLAASFREFYVWPGEIDEILVEPERGAATAFDQTRLENALQNAFKAIEAVVGDPPKDDRKLFAKLEAIGLDPVGTVGYAEKRLLHEVIRDMNRARDKKVAHGSTGDRFIKYGELMEYQACARYIVWAGIERKLGKRLF